MVRTLCVGAGLGLLVWFSGTVLAADKPDLMAGVFDPPAGVRLRSDQQEQLRKLKQRYEPPLRSAIRKYESATEERERIPLAREITKLKGEVKQEMERILAAPDPEMIKRMKEAEQKAREQAKKQQQKAQAAKKNNRKKH